jgi:hypothetical protein
MVWDKGLAGHIYLDGLTDKIANARVDKKVVYLTLTAPSNARRITYIKGDFWNAKEAFLKGKNGIAALTFCEVPILRK